MKLAALLLTGCTLGTGGQAWETPDDASHSIIHDAGPERIVHEAEAIVEASPVHVSPPVYDDVPEPDVEASVEAEAASPEASEPSESSCIYTWSSGERYDASTLPYCMSDSQYWLVSGVDMPGECGTDQCLSMGGGSFCCPCGGNVEACP